MALTNAEIEKMSFREKQKYFEEEMKAQSEAASAKTVKQFSYLSEHEIATMRQEEAKKVGGMSKAQILSSYVAGEDGDEEDDDLDKVLANLEAKRMKSLEVDAVQAQAVIAKAQEMAKDSRTAGHNSVDSLPSADADEGNHPNHNGDSRDMGRKSYYRMGIGESQH